MRYYVLAGVLTALCAGAGLPGKFNGMLPAAEAQPVGMPWQRAIQDCRSRSADGFLECLDRTIEGLHQKQENDIKKLREDFEVVARRLGPLKVCKVHARTPTEGQTPAPIEYYVPDNWTIWNCMDHRNQTNGDAAEAICVWNKPLPVTSATDQLLEKSIGRIFNWQPDQNHIPPDNRCGWRVR